MSPTTKNIYKLYSLFTQIMWLENKTTIQIVESCQPQPVAPESHLILHQLIQHHFTVRLSRRSKKGEWESGKQHTVTSSSHDKIFSVNPFIQNCDTTLRIIDYSSFTWTSLHFSSWCSALKSTITLSWTDIHMKVEMSRLTR